MGACVLDQVEDGMFGNHGSLGTWHPTTWISIRGSDDRTIMA